MEVEKQLHVHSCMKYDVSRSACHLPGASVIYIPLQQQLPNTVRNSEKNRMLLFSSRLQQ